MFSRIQGYKDNLNYPPLPLSTSISSSVDSRRSLSIPQIRVCPSSSSSTLSSNAQFVVSSLLKRDPASRMAAAEILESDWLIT